VHGGISFASKTYEKGAMVQRNLRKLKHIHIIPLTGTKPLPATVEGVLSIPGHALGAHRAEVHSHAIRRCSGFLQFDSQEPKERLE
jgi:hypothetical protein